MALRTKPIAPPDLADLDSGKPRLLPVDSIDEDPEQPRREFDDESLGELAETIKARGVRSPVSVRPHPLEPGRWILNFGARRLRATKLLAKEDIPAFVDETFDSYDQVIENEQRESLKPIELALFVKRQLDRGQSRAEIARGIGKSQPYITYACSLIDPPDWLMDMYRSGRCRGMLELHELRRLHETDPHVLETWLPGMVSVGRGELQQLKARVSEARQCKPCEGDARGDGAASTDAVASTTMPTTDPARSSPPSASGLASQASLRAGAPEILKRIKPADDGYILQPVTARKVMVLAEHGGATVRVVLDELPHAGASVFVMAEGGKRSAVRIASLADVRLALDPVPQP